MAPWKNETVSLLLTGIRKEDAYDRLPVLADALEEAGYDDPQVLAALRLNPSPLAGPWVERVVAGVVDCADLHVAVENLASTFDDYISTTADTLPYSPVDDVPRFLWVMAVCRKYFEEGQEKDTVKVPWRDVAVLVDTYDLARDEELWETYKSLTGDRPDPPEDDRPDPPEDDDYYSCAC